MARRSLIALATTALALSAAVPRSAAALPDDAEPTPIMGESPPAPASAPAAPQDGAEDLSDPEDSDGWSAPKSAAPAKVAGASAEGIAAAAPQTRQREMFTWSAQAVVRLAFDTDHTEARPGAAVVLREDVMALNMDLAIRLQLRPTRKIRLQAGGRLSFLVTTRRPEDPDESYAVFNGDVHRTDFEVHLDDTFVELSTGRVDVQIGMITTVWGANDLVNPNDLLTAKDLRYGVVSDASAMRIPVLSARAELYLGKLTVAAVWQPVFTPDRIDLFGGDYAVLGPGAQRALRLLGDLADHLTDDTVEGRLQPALIASSQPRPFSGSTLGVRLSGSIAGWDVAAQYVFTHERLPVMVLRGDFIGRLMPWLERPLPGSTTELLRDLSRHLGAAPPVETTHQRQHQAGLSLSRVLWRFVVNTDVSFLSRQAELLGGDMPLMRDGDRWSTSVDTPVVSYTVGGRYSRGEDLLLKLEWWHQLLINPLSRGEGQRPALLLGGPQRAGLALLFRYSIPGIDVTFQGLVHSEVFHRSLIVAPQLDYRVSDHLTLFTGATIYAGKKGPGALYDDNDQVHVGLKGYL